MILISSFVIAIESPADILLHQLTPESKGNWTRFHVTSIF